MNCILNYTIRYQGRSLTEFLRFGTGRERFYFESSQSPLAIAGLGIAAQISSTGKNRFGNLSHQALELFGRIHSWTNNTPRPILLGGGSFFAEMNSSKWDTFPTASLVLPRHTLTRIDNRFYFSVNLPFKESESLTEISCRAQIESENFITRMDSASLPAPSMPDEISLHATSRKAWQAAIEHSIEMIRTGRIQKVVMARHMQVTSNRPADVPTTLERLRETCPDCFHFLFEFSAGTAFAGASPERLVSVSGQKFTTAAIAGSIRRGEFPGEDESLGNQLLDSAKDQSEHQFVVEQIREKMLPWVKNLHIDSDPQLLKLPNIYHLRTDFTGTLQDNQNILNIVNALHPTPAVGGVPEETALKAIRLLEEFERGWYAAPIGWVDANGDGDFVVAIRSGLFQKQITTLYGGAGIVADSDPQKEWEETALKMRILLNAMQYETA